MALTPIFDLTNVTEKAEAMSFISNYKYYSGLGTYTDNQLQVEINNASQRIYNFTRYHPKTTSQSMTIPISNTSGLGIIPYKIPTNLTSAVTSDYKFTGVVLTLSYITMQHDGNIFIGQFVYDPMTNVKHYPEYITITIDYGFTKSTQMPLEFKSACIDLVMHYLTSKQDQALRETSKVQDNQIIQEYNKFVSTELSILKPLSNVRIY